MKNDIENHEIITNQAFAKVELSTFNQKSQHETYLQERAQRGSRKHALEILSKIADREPEDFDRIRIKTTDG